MEPLPPSSTPSKLTRLSKLLAALLLAVFAVTWFFPSTKEYLSLVPGRTLPCVWNLVTAGFVTVHPAEVLVEVAAVLLLARLIEPIYGSTEFLKLILLVDLAASTATFILVYLIYLALQTFKGGLILYAEFSGFHGILAGMLVAVKQIMPDHEVKLLGFIKLRARYFPSIFVLFGTALVVGLRLYAALPFLWFGTYSSWLYLRYFQQQPELSIHGDPSEDFKFSSFFPDCMAVPIDFIAGIFAFVFRLKHAQVPESKLHLPATASLLGSDAADASRRRERGAKALEERLGLKKAAKEDLESGAATDAPVAKAPAQEKA